MKKTCFILMLVVVVLSSGVWAQTVPISEKPVSARGVADLKYFSSIAILDHGRVKPLETFAQNILMQFSGRSTFEKKKAINWLARVLFDPQATYKDKVFLINNPSIADSLGVKPEKSRRYSYYQLESTMGRLRELAMSADAIDPKKRDVVESELIRLYGNLSLYSQLTLNFAFILPHPDFTVNSLANRKMLGLDEKIKQYSFLDIAMAAESLEKVTRPLEKTAEDKWTEDQRELVQLMASLFDWSSFTRDLPLTILPSYNPQEEAWFSPWDALQMIFHSKDGQKEILLGRDIVVSYWNGESLEFNAAVKNFNHSIEKRLEGRSQNFSQSISLELFYNKTNLFFWAKILFFLAFLAFLLSLGRELKVLYTISGVLVLAGFLFNTVGLLLRIMILQRPPVSNLYETFIFVSFISVGTGLVIEWIQKKWSGLLVSSICGYIFLTIASKFATEGDTLQMLVAVLNSNFWLGTHVISITIGYAGVCVAGVVGHLYLLQRIFKPQDKELHLSTYRFLIGTLGFGLTMSFLGTNLGGIWADQSWGRFWGWDPKENGALMIVLWSALLFHAKIAKVIGEVGLAVGSILGIIVVMWAWFGVNLLSIGLHSYGFTAGLALNLTIYFVCQVLFLVVTVPLAKRNPLKKS